MFSNLSIHRIIPFFLFVTLFSLPSSFAGGKGACQSDALKFCGSVSQDKGQKMRCLKAHESELSPVCQARVKDKEARHRDCKADRERVCKNVQPGEGRIRQCMKDHQAELSSTCQAHFQRPKGV